VIRWGGLANGFGSSSNGCTAPTSAPLCLRHVVDVRIHRKQTRRGRIRITRVAGQQQSPIHVQQTAMSPIAGVEFLAGNHLLVGIGQRIALTEAIEIREALLFVDDEVL